MTESLHQLLESGIRAGLFPGCSAGWCGGGFSTVQFDSAGFSHLSTDGTKTTPELLYDLASLTKPLVVTTLFLLARRSGVVDLECEVGEILHDVGPFGSATMEQVLTHTAGLPAWVPLYASEKPPGELQSVIKMLRPVGSLGKQVEYSCPGFILMGMVLEKVLGTGLGKAFFGLVAQPLGLGGQLTFKPPADSFVAGGARSPGAEIRLMRTIGGDVSTIPASGPKLPDDGNARYLGGIAGNSGLFGSVRGVVRLAQEFLPGGGRLLTAEEADMAAQCRTQGLNQHRGLGWQIATSPGCSAGSAISRDSIGHVGFTGTSLWIDRRRGCTMTLLSNRHHPAHRQTDLHPMRRRFNALVSAICRDD